MPKKPSKKQIEEIKEIEKLEAPAEIKRGVTNQYFAPAKIEMVEVEQDEPVEVIDGTHERAELIRSFFPAAADVFSGDFDESNPDHLVIAAFTVGRRGMLRR